MFRTVQKRNDRVHDTGLSIIRRKTMQSNTFLFIYLAVIVVVMILVTVIPAKKEKKKRDELMSRLAVGDYCCTTSGMYGKIIDITSDMVIVEFGGKNCRIPMLKGAIASVEKANAITSGGISDEAKRSAEGDK